MKTVPSAFKSFPLCTIIIIISFAILTAGCGGGGGGGNSNGNNSPPGPDICAGDNPDPSCHNSILKNLGIETEIGERKAPDGESIPKTLNPLGKKISELTRIPELFIAGAKLKAVNDSPYPGTHHYSLIDEPTESPTELLTSKDDTRWCDKTDARRILNSAHKVATEGDIDGDGLEEILVASVTWNKDTKKHSDPKIQIIDDTNGNYQESHHLLPLENEHFVFKFKTGDVDNDGRDELILISSLTEKDISTNTSNKILIFDDSANNFALLHEINKNVFFRDIAVADLDNDGADEIATIDSYGSSNVPSKFYIFDDGEMGAFKLIKDKSMIIELLDSNPFSFQGADQISVGDFDGDKLLELAVINKQRVALIDDHLSSFLLMKATSLSETRIPRTNAANVPFQKVDLNGDFVDELLVSTSIMKFEFSQKNTFTTSFPHDDFIRTNGGETDIPVYEINSATTGNFDADNSRKEEIAILVSQAGLNNAIYGKELWILGENSNGDLRIKNRYSFDLNDTCQRRIVITGANIDNDSAVLEYREEHELLFTDPIVIGVLASPPYYASGIQNTDGSYTLLGQESGSTTEHSNSLGITFGMSYGLGLSGGLTQSSFEAKAALEGSVNYFWGTSQETINAQAYQTSAGKDLVIFTSIPYDVYYYDVISSENPDAIGKTVTVNVPRKPNIHHLEREFYNEHNGKNLDIVLGHTPGDPFSYPSNPSELTRSGGIHLVSNTPMTVSGSGEIFTQTVQRTNSSTDGVTGEIDVKFETEAVVVGVLVGSSFGFHYGHEFSITVSDSTIIEGAVGDMFQEQFDLEKSYNWGVFLHEFQKDNIKFPVVNYWVTKN